MKFLCPNCKAKYQISDEKIAGRTLKMDCRRCEHPILIRGQAKAGGRGAGKARKRSSRSSSGARETTKRQRPAPTAGRPSTTGSRRPSKVASPPPKKEESPALGRELHEDSTTSMPGERLLDQWHIAINDVPVGPMQREEVARKVQAKAVGKSSLVWHEGFDDWRPLSDVPDLMALYHEHHSKTPPPQPLPAPPAPPAPLAPTSPLMEAARDSAPEPPPEDDLPIGAPIEAPPEAPPDSESETGLFDAFAASPPQRAAEPSVVIPIPEDDELPVRRGLPVGAWMGVAGASAFGIALAFMVGYRYLIAPTLQPAVVEAEAPGAPPAVEERPNEELVLPEAEISAAATDEAAEGEAAEGAARRGPRPSGEHREPRHAAAPEAEAAPAGRPTGGGGGSHLTAEQAARLARLGGGGGTTATPLKRTGRSLIEEDRGGSGPALTADQIRQVVDRERPQLQRCYETAARGLGDAPTARMDVRLTIAPSGAVSSVQTAGGATMAGLGACVQRSVRRWRFPRSGRSTPMEFPLVFAGRQ